MDELVSDDFEEIEDVILKRQTDRAGLFLMPDGEEVWIPFSQIEDNGEDLKNGYEGSIWVAGWLARKKGII